MNRPRSAYVVNADARARLIASSPGPVDVWQPTTLRDRFDAVAGRDPQRLAIAAEGEQCTYAELQTRVDELSERLRAELGGGTSLLCGIRGGTTLRRVTAQLGVLLAGHSAFTIEPHNRTERQRACVERAGVQLTIDCDRGFTWESPPDCSRLAADNVPDREPGVLFFTSGTTGEPKGVLFPVRCLLQDIARQTRTMRISAADRFDLLFSLGFSASLAPMYGALLNGASLHLASLDTIGIAGLFDWLRNRTITISTMGPATLRSLTRTAPPGERLPNLRFLCSGGDVLTGADLQSAKDFLPENAVVQNAYASTETRTISELLLTVDAEPPPGPLSVGCPVEGKRIRLEQPGHPGQPVPIGGVGEIVIESEWLPRTEFDPTQPTRFTFDEQTRAVTYRTGDLGRYDEEGELHFVGRGDDLLKVAGYRVHPAEIEGVLEAHPGIQRAVVVKERKGIIERLVAGIEWRGEAIPPHELQDFLSTRLPASLTPKRFVAIEEWPLNANGKLDRNGMAKFLETPNDVASVSEDVPICETLRRWCAELLRRDTFSPVDSFFTHGGDSLGAVELQLRIAERWGVPITYADLIASPSPQKLTTIIEREGDPDRLPSDSPLVFVGGSSGIGLMPPAAGRFFVAHRRVLDCLSYPGIRDGEPIASTIPEIARVLIERLERYAVREPIELCGYSLGASIAIEMAQQLIERGRTVRGVVLWDGFAPGFGTRAHPKLYWQRFRRAVRLPFGRRTEEEPRRRTEVITHAVQAWRRYQPRPVTVPVLLLMAKRRHFQTLFPTAPLNGWDPDLFADLQAVSVPGDHHEIVQDPFARELVAQTIRFFERLSVGTRAA